MFTPASPVYPPPPPPRSRAMPYVVALIIVALVGGYLLVGVLTRDKWAGTITQERTRVTVAAHAPGGSPVSSADLAQAREVLGERLDDLRIPGAAVAVEADHLVVIVPGRSGGVVKDIIRSGQLHIRPVVDSAPISGARPSSTPAPPAFRDPNERAKAVAFQKLLRQTPGMEREAYAYLTQTRCEEPDLLAGIDDPALPLVTCGVVGTTGQKMIYVLEESVIDGDQIDTAASLFDEQSGQWLVRVKFNAAATKVWADYTAGHVDTATGFVLDTEVISAPVIREAIPGGTTQISGDFTIASARDLANVLTSGALPSSLSLTYESATTETTAAGGAKSTALRIGLAAAGAGVFGVVAGLITYLVRRWSRGRSVYAAEVTRYTS
ncbi:MAG: preprotein translocase subunit SecD [Mycobacterium sp.]|nr:preprotein translocase subunit SecD [Mycobacterium sp.]